MRGAARAIAWEFSSRYRLALAAMAVYLVAFVLARVFVLPPDAHFRFTPPNGLGAFVLAPATVGFLFFVAVFTYGLDGDLAARESIFPRRMFTLPIGTAALAGWPMLYGVAASLAVWGITISLAQWATGGNARVPRVWPGFLIAAWLAWMQALMWLPYGLRNLRIVVAVAWLVTVDAIVMIAAYSGASEAAMIAFLAPQLPLAYLVAWYAVGRARQGHAPEWRLPFAASGALRRRDAFPSAAQAQAWFEWRRHGWTLPALTAPVVACELLLLFIPGNDAAGIVFGILVIVLLTPPVMALFAAPALATSTVHALTRPMTSVAIVAAKVRMTVGSTLVAWGIVVPLAILALLLSGAMPLVVARIGVFLEATDAVRGSILLLGVVAACVLATWKNLVLSLAVGLTGRERVTKAVVLAVFALLIAAFPLAYGYARSDAAQSFVWDYLPWFVAAAVVLKVSAACGVAIGLQRRGVVGDRTLVAAAAAWLAAVAALYAFLQWLAQAPVFPFYLVAAVAILAVPLARLSAAPLALAWGRHR